MMQMKKWLVTLLSLVLAFGFTACSGSQAPAEAPVGTEVPVGEEAPTYVLNYDTIAAWVNGGYLGFSDAGEAILLVFNADMTMGGMIFGDPASGDAASFFGELTDNGDGSVTITDEVNGLSITFGVEQVSDTVMALDMGEELGAAQIEAASLDVLLESLRGAIDNFNHVA